MDFTVQTSSRNKGRISLDRGKARLYAFLSLYLLIHSAAMASAGDNVSGSVSSNFFGMHVNLLTTPWPSVNVGAQRLWDAGISWAEVNTSNGGYDFSVFDQVIARAQSHNAEILYDLGRTPLWASSNPTDTTCNEGPGQCWAPIDLDINGNGTNQIWKNWVGAVATRYKGKIKYYEIWNEPNNLNWAGSTAQLVRLAQDARSVILAIDPQAQFTTPAPQPGGWKAWMTDYLNAGGGQYADIIAFHGYSGSPWEGEKIGNMAENVRSLLVTYGFQNKPFFDSEDSWGNNNVTDLDLQTAYVAHLYLVAASHGISHLFWYTWGNDTPAWGTLWLKGSGITPAGVAYGQVYNWLTGATLSGPCTIDVKNTWTCQITRPGNYQALAVWNSSGTVTSYTAGSAYKQYEDLTGKTIAYSGGAVSIGPKPLLFENGTINNTFPAPILNLPAALPINAQISATYNGTVPAAYYSWSFQPLGPASSSAGSFSALAAGAASFTTPGPQANLGSQPLVLGSYAITVNVVDNNGNASPKGQANVTLVSADLSAVRVFPNPWRSDKHSRFPVTFDNLSVNSVIKIFTVSGHFVKTLQTSSTASTWDLTNNAGDKVASGMYVYAITDDLDQKKTGQVAVIK